MVGRVSVRFNASHFPGHVSASGHLTFDVNELAHALFVTGRAPGDWVTHGMASLWEWRHRTAVIPAYLRVSSTGELRKSDLAQELDRSEKVGLSYALGQAMTTIFCRHRLNVGHLMHIDRYQRRYNVTFGATKKRPDLIGQVGLGGRWVVAEAKGRSNDMEVSLPGKILAQKGAVRSIQGATPHMSLGCVAAFPKYGPNSWGPLKVYAVDPEPASEGIDIELNESRFLAAYYEPFVAAVLYGDRQPDAGGLVSSVVGPGLVAGVDEQIFAAITQDAASGGLTADRLGQILGDAEVSRAWHDDGRFSDGTFVQANWADAMSVADYGK